jgi:hypothetical protein
MIFFSISTNQLIFPRPVQRATTSTWAYLIHGFGVVQKEVKSVGWWNINCRRFIFMLSDISCFERSVRWRIERWLLGRIVRFNKRICNFRWLPADLRDWILPWVLGFSCSRYLRFSRSSTHFHFLPTFHYSCPTVHTSHQTIQSRACTCH